MDEYELTKKKVKSKIVENSIPKIDYFILREDIIAQYEQATWSHEREIQDSTDVSEDRAVTLWVYKTSNSISVLLGIYKNGSRDIQEYYYLKGDSIRMHRLVETSQHDELLDSNNYSVENSDSELLDLTKEEFSIFKSNSIEYQCSPDCGIPNSLEYQKAREEDILEKLDWLKANLAINLESVSSHEE